MSRRLQQAWRGALLLLFVASPGRAEEGRLRVWVGEVALTDAARERVGDALDARLCAVVAQGLSDLSGFEPLTGEAAAAGADDLGAGVEQARQAKADLLLRAAAPCCCRTRRSSRTRRTRWRSACSARSGPCRRRRPRRAASSRP